MSGESVFLEVGVLPFLAHLSLTRAYRIMGGLKKNEVFFKN